VSAVEDSFEDQVAGSTRRRHPTVGASPTAARVDALRVRQQLRSSGIDQRHVAALAELGGNWPPILVWGQHPDLVLDGAHRLAAARKLGHDTVQVVTFHGTADEAFVETVRRNIAHGLPLSVPDRTSAGLQILDQHPEWSDRRIAEACGLSPHTVARLRGSLAPTDTSRGEVAATHTPPEDVVESLSTPPTRTRQPKAQTPCATNRPGPTDRVVAIESRLGRDGKSRPAQPGLLRDRVVEALKANPGGSLRQIARVAKVSPETVRRIRREFEEPDGPDIKFLAAMRAPAEADTDWREDPALRGNAELVTWLDLTDPSGDLETLAFSVPLSRVYQLSDEARRRAARWIAFAEALESRARGCSRGYPPLSLQASEP
jgi:transcriptional regulator with XRE-family HTH domain